MKHVVRNQRGMALALVLLALVVVGGLVAGALFAGTQEERFGENERRLQQSFGVAEAGAVEQIRTWTPGVFNVKRPYPQDSVVIGTTTTSNGTGSYTGVVHKMNGNIYLVAVTGSDKNSSGAVGASTGARQQVGILTKIDPIQFSAKGALVSGGSTKIQDNITIDGNDHVPAGWTGCDPLGAAVPGLHVDSGAKIISKPPTIIVGSPAVLTDNQVNDSTFTKYGDYTYAKLAAAAMITLPGGNYAPQPVVTNGVCDQSVHTNWGDGLNPNGACGNYFPLIHVTGGLKINTGPGVQGQGVLLVDGKLEAKGPFSWFGIIIAQDGLKTYGDATGDPHFLGTILSGSKTAIKTKADTLTGVTNAQVGYSSCAILKAIQGTAFTTLMRSRNWAQLF